MPASARIHGCSRGCPSGCLRFTPSSNAVRLASPVGSSRLDDCASGVTGNLRLAVERAEIAFVTHRRVDDAVATVVVSPARQRAAAHTASLAVARAVVAFLGPLHDAVATVGPPHALPAATAVDAVGVGLAVVALLGARDDASACSTTSPRGQSADSTCTGSVASASTAGRAKATMRAVWESVRVRG